MLPQLQIANWQLTLRQLRGNVLRQGGLRVKLSFSLVARNFKSNILNKSLNTGKQLLTFLHSVSLYTLPQLAADLKQLRGRRVTAGGALDKSLSLARNGINSFIWN